LEMSEIRLSLIDSNWSSKHSARILTADPQ
jgi:hypothetical protein